MLAPSAWLARRAAWAFEDRLLGPIGERLHGGADLARWPFERLVWLFERRLLWPLQKRAAGASWSLPRSAAGAGALAALALAAVVVGVLWPSGGNGSPERSAQQARVAIVPPAPQPPAEQSQGPTLQGVPPSFGAGEGAGASKAAGGDAGPTGLEAPAAEAEAGGAALQPEEGAATTSSAKAVPAGPAAMKVARRFSEAFVFYEIGERAAQAKAVFAQTATPQLATALGERPPRLPADAKVPKARVLNLVPGPRAGKAYTVSVSLLRVGVTSELRLTLQEGRDGEWSVAQILG